jgi:hypothetical protein
MAPDFFDFLGRRNYTDASRINPNDQTMSTMRERPDSFAVPLGLPILLLTVCTAASAAPLTVTLNPSADAFVSNNNLNSNYGGAGALEVSGSASSNGAFESVLMFADSAAKSAFDAQFGANNWTVTGISLKLTSATVNNSLFNAQSSGTLAATWMQNHTWTEGTGSPANPTTDGITAATLPSFLGPNDQSLGSFFFDSSVSGTSGASATYPLALSPGILNDIAAGNLSSMELAPADANVSYLVNSRSFVTTGSRPVLSITATAVPEPSTLVILGFAAAVFSWRQKNRRT